MIKEGSSPDTLVFDPQNPEEVEEVIDRRIQLDMVGGGADPSASPAQASFEPVYLAISNIGKEWTMPIRDWGMILHQFLIKFEERCRSRTLRQAQLVIRK